MKFPLTTENLHLLTVGDKIRVTWPEPHSDYVAVGTVEKVDKINSFLNFGGFILDLNVKAGHTVEILEKAPSTRMKVKDCKDKIKVGDRVKVYNGNDYEGEIRAIKEDSFCLQFGLQFGKDRYAYFVFDNDYTEIEILNRPEVKSKDYQAGFEDGQRMTEHELTKRLESALAKITAIQIEVSEMLTSIIKQAD